MKLKITLVFVLIAVTFLYLVFQGGYFPSNKAVVVSKAESALTGAAILEKISQLDLRDYEGNKISVNKDELLATEKVVIHAWASWCGPCVTEVPELIEYSKKNPQVKFIIVSEDDYTEDIQKFMKSFPEFNSDKFIRIWDGTKAMSALLKIDRLPMSVLINKNKAEPKYILAAVDWKRLEF